LEKKGVITLIDGPPRPRRLRSIPFRPIRGGHPGSGISWCPSKRKSHKTRRQPRSIAVGDKWDVAAIQGTGHELRFNRKLSLQAIGLISDWCSGPLAATEL